MKSTTFNIRMRKNPNLLNDRDKALISFCATKGRTLGEISRYLKFIGLPTSVKNVSARIPNLISGNFITVNKPANWKSGMKKEIKSKDTSSAKYLILLLAAIKHKGIVTFGELQEEIQSIDFFKDPHYYQKTKALRDLPFTAYVETCYRLTPEGEKYFKKLVKENSKKK